VPVVEAEHEGKNDYLNHSQDEVKEEKEGAAEPVAEEEGEVAAEPVVQEVAAEPSDNNTMLWLDWKTTQLREENQRLTWLAARGLAEAEQSRQLARIRLRPRRAAQRGQLSRELNAVVDRADANRGKSKRRKR
jgi:hypothetical protein